MLVMLASPDLQQAVEQGARDLHHFARGLKRLLVFQQVGRLLIEADPGLGIKRGLGIGGDAVERIAGGRGLLDRAGAGEQQRVGPAGDPGGRECALQRGKVRGIAAVRPGPGGRRLPGRGSG